MIDIPSKFTARLGARVSVGWLAALVACSRVPEDSAVSSELRPEATPKVALELPDPPATPCSPILAALEAGEVAEAQRLHQAAEDEFELRDADALAGQRDTADDERRRVLAECLYARGVLARDTGLGAPLPGEQVRDPLRARLAFERSRAFVDDARVQAALADFEPLAKLEATVDETAAAVGDDICAARLLPQGREWIWKWISENRLNTGCSFRITAPDGPTPADVDARIVELELNTYDLLMLLVVQSADEARVLSLTRMSASGVASSAELAIDAFGWKDVGGSPTPELVAEVTALHNHTDEECDSTWGDVDQRLVLCAGLDCAVVPVAFYSHEDGGEDGEGCVPPGPEFCDGGALAYRFDGGGLRLKSTVPKRCKQLEPSDQSPLPAPGKLALDAVLAEHAADELWSFAPEGH